MVTRTQASSSKRGFTLVELVIVLTIMLVMIGVAGSLLSGMLTMHQVTVEQGTAYRRAQDVFSILRPALQNAGLGAPASDDMARATYGTGYGWNCWLGSWGAPLEVETSTVDEKYGDVLRVAWSMPTGLKYSGSDIVTSFGEPALRSATLKFAAADDDDAPDAAHRLFARLTSANAGPGGIKQYVAGTYDLSSVVTFPGSEMHPLFVTNINTADQSLTLLSPGRRPDAPTTQISGALPAGRVFPNSELLIFRAATAFVDDSSTFRMIDAPQADPMNGGAFAATIADAPGFSVEGIKAVRFLLGEDGRSITVWLLVEGDVEDARRHATSGANAAVRARKTTKWNAATRAYDTIELWEDVEFDPDLYYEDFFSTFRLRDLRNS